LPKIAGKTKSPVDDFWIVDWKSYKPNFSFSVVLHDYISGVVYFSIDQEGFILQAI